MKQKSLLVIIVAFLSIVTVLKGYSQNTNQEWFAKGNSFYKQGKYEQAIENYQKITGTENADLYFNLGNSYYKLNKVAQAIYYYEKALKINPSYTNAKNNLVFAKRMTIDAIEPLPKTFLQRLSKNTIQQFTYNTWAIISVISSFLLVLFFMLYYFSYSSTKKLLWFNAFIFSLASMLLAVIFTFSSYNIKTSQRSAIVFSPSVEIKNAPTLNGDAIFELHEGTKVQLLDELEGWKKIKISNGKEGWIEDGDVKEI